VLSFNTLTGRVSFHFFDQAENFLNDTNSFRALLTRTNVQHAPPVSCYLESNVPLPGMFVSFSNPRIWNDRELLNLDDCGYTATATKSIQITQCKLLSLWFLVFVPLSRFENGRSRCL